MLVVCHVRACVCAEDDGGVIAVQKAIKFNGGGHINHSIFWNNLSPNGGDLPCGMNRHFRNVSLSLSLYFPFSLPLPLILCVSVVQQETLWRQ